MTPKNSIAVTGASGRIGQLCQQYWPDIGVSWLARADLKNMTSHFAGRHTVLALAGPVPGRGDVDIGAHEALARATFDAAREAGVAHLIYLSSGAVYGRVSGLVCESVPPAPISPYGADKWAAERAIMGRVGPQVTVLRLGNLAGADALLGGAVTNDLGTADTPVNLHIFPDGHGPKRSYIGPITLADTLISLINTLFLNPKSVPPLLNVAQQGEVDMKDLLDAAGLHWRAEPAPVDALASLCFDVSKLEALIDLPAADPIELVAQWRASQGKT